MFNKKTKLVSLFAVITAILTLGLLFVVPVIAKADNSTDGVLVVIHDRGEEKTIITNATTIGEAVKEAGITLDSKDAVEPGIDTKLVASSYQVNIYRARPVIIEDGNTKIKVITPYQTAKQIAADAGITLYDEDLTTLTQTDVATEGAGLKLTITRATDFTFNLYGKIISSRTQAKTVGEMLKEKGIIMSDDDKVSPNSDVEITAGMTIKVWREGKQTITVDEEVSYDTEQIESADYEAGYVEIRTDGQNGERTVTYEIIVENGVEVSRTEINSLITRQPMTQVEVVGIKGKYNTPTENENITWSYLIDQGFSRIQAAGIMGNLKQESNFKTAGDGIVQWGGSRKDKLISLYPRSYDSIYSQLEYMMYELNGSYSSVKNSVLASNSLSEVVAIFQNKYEACNPLYCNYSNRYSYAQNILASH